MNNNVPFKVAVSTGKKLPWKSFVPNARQIFVPQPHQFNNNNEHANFDQQQQINYNIAPATPTPFYNNQQQQPNNFAQNNAVLNAADPYVQYHMQYVAPAAPQQPFYGRAASIALPNNAAPSLPVHQHIAYQQQQQYLSTSSASVSSTASFIHNAYQKQKFQPVVALNNQYLNKEKVETFDDSSPLPYEEDFEEYFAPATPAFHSSIASSSIPAHLQAPPASSSMPFAAPKGVAGARFYKNDNNNSNNNFAKFTKPQATTTVSTQQQRFYATNNLVQQQQEVVSSLNNNNNIFNGNKQLVEYGDHEGQRKFGFIVGPMLSSNPNVAPQFFQLEDGNGQSRFVDAKDLSYYYSGLFPPQQLANIVSRQDLQLLQDEVSTLVNRGQPRVEEVWRVFLQSKKSFSVTSQEVASYLFESSNLQQQSPNTSGAVPSAASIVAAHKLLSSSPAFFKQVNETMFECRSVREVEEKKHLPDEIRTLLFNDKLFLVKLLNALLTHPSTNDSIKDQYTLTKAKTLREIKSLQADKSLCLDDVRLNADIDSHRIDLLKQFALGSSSSSEVYDKYLKPLGLDNSSLTAFNLCRKLNFFDTDNIHLLRANVNFNFPTEVEDLARKIRDNPSAYPDPDSSIRRNLTHLDVFAIDSIPETDEVDDAISVQVKEDGSEYVYIHIADPTRFIPYGSTMEQTAASRVTSIYLPELKVPMLPRAISVDLLSLNEKSQNFTLTFAARVLPNGELVDCEIFPATLGKVQRLDYDETDLVFEHVSTVEEKTYDLLQRMLRIANTRLSYRVKRGATPFNIPRADVSVDKKGKVTVEPSKDLASHSRRLVQEFMIMANEISAKFAHEKNIIIPFRATFGGVYEERPEAQVPEVNLAMSEEELVGMVMTHHQTSQNNNSGAACFSQMPSFHIGLGVDAYTQVTSPIRRYCDLLVHYQLKAQLRGEKAPMEWAEIQQTLVHVEQKTRSIAALQRNSERFWLYKYFEQNMGKLYKALVLDSTNESYKLLHEFQTLVYMVDIGLKTKVKLNRETRPGDTIYLKVTSVVPNADVLKMEEANSQKKA